MSDAHRAITDGPVASSFRDPHGFVFRRDGVLYRQVNEVHRDDFEHLIGSGLYDALVAEGLLVPHEDAELGLASAPNAYRIIRPRPVPFVSYPYEWGYLQLRDAALATLRIQSEALGRGMTLRDATAFNITFEAGRPVLLDTTSFGILAEGEPWVAYRQFCQHFLAPLALMAYVDPRLGQLSKVFLDGVPLDLAAELLPRKASMKPGLVMHLRMHAKSQRKHQADETPAREQARSFSPRAFEGLLDSLRKAIEGLSEPSGDGPWRDYYADADHYPDDAAARKEQVVAHRIEELQPSVVWDLGANTGRFATLASSRGIDAVAFEMDPACVDEAYRRARDAGDTHLLPLVLDLANPSPPIGWANGERMTLQDRGPADLVLALALIHHLAIANNVPVPMILDLIARLGRSAVIEWIPKSDPKVQMLLRHREDVFGDYTEEVFDRALRERFHVLGVEALGETGRSLHVVERR